METAVAWIIRIIAVFVFAFSFVIFFVLGGSMWVVMVFLGTFYLIFSVVFSALLTQQPDMAALDTFRSMIGFFPNGVRAIAEVCLAVWHNPLERPQGGGQTPRWLRIASGVLARALFAWLVVRFVIPGGLDGVRSFFWWLGGQMSSTPRPRY